MNIEFVNHSSFIVEQSNTRIICDPWIEGTVFNNGWKLISETKFSYSDFENIDYIWFSHEHPDHFYPPNIKSIPAEHRKKIKVLFQETIDCRVVNFCEKLGFKEIIELKPNEWYSLEEGFQVMCEHFQEGDSWIAFKSKNHTFLNTNDCGIRNVKDAEEIQSKVGKVDVLLTQFSYAYWVGNPDQKEFRKKKAQEKLDWLKFQCDIYNPTVTIPIASYVYFCHEENYWLNDSINTPSKVFDFINSKTTSSAVILYPGDVYHYPDKHESKQALEKYSADYQKINDSSNFYSTGQIAEDTLLSEARVFGSDLKKKLGFILSRQIKETSIYVSDFNQAYALTVDGLTEKNQVEAECDVSMSAENLIFCFKYPYGLDTTQISGRMQKPSGGDYPRFYNFFRVNQLLSRGIDPNGISFLSGVAKRKVLNKLGLYKY